MKTTKLLMSALGATALSVCAFAAENATAETPELKPGMTKIEKIATTRLIAATTPGNALKDWMTSGALKRWNDVYGAMIGSDGSSAIMSDFFSGALLLSGPQNDMNGVYALFNPFQDTVLLIQTDNTELLPRIEDFAFLTGTDFRGETLKDNEYPQAIAPTNGNFDELLLKNTAGVYAAFNREFPQGATENSIGKFRRFNNDGNYQKVAFNGALRLALLKKFTLPEANDDALAAGEIALLLWEGDEAKIKDFFTIPKAGDLFVKYYVSLPEQVKESMMPVLYFKNKQAVLFGFSSRLLPELVILVRVAADGKEKPRFTMVPLAAELCSELYPAAK